MDLRWYMFAASLIFFLLNTLSSNVPYGFIFLSTDCAHITFSCVVYFVSHAIYIYVMILGRIFKRILFPVLNRFLLIHSHLFSLPVSFSKSLWIYRYILLFTHLYSVHLFTFKCLHRASYVQVSIQHRPEHLTYKNNVSVEYLIHNLKFFSSASVFCSFTSNQSSFSILHGTYSSSMTLFW